MSRKMLDFYQSNSQDVEPAKQKKVKKAEKEKNVLDDA